ncbi:MAG: WG repeat-containing protein [Acidobacteria bacterium]|nr:WG repeat-containing protein [Acidobacteriota bacterium]
MDKTGKFIIEPIFFSAGRFSEGLAAVWKDGESGFIDKQGNWKIKLRFNSTEGFNEGFAAIENNGKIGYIDKTGKYIWKPTK